MPRRITKYRCLIISPSDVEEERRTVANAIDGWNAHIGGLLESYVEAVAWEVHALPALGDRLRECVARHAPDSVTEAMNRVLDDVKEPADGIPSRAARRTLERSEW